MNENSETLFVVSSAITTKYGVYHRSNRIKQTQETLDSIRKFSPKSDIVVLDGGMRDLESFEKNTLFKGVLEFRNFSKDEFVKSIHSGVDNHDIVKNMIEIYIFMKYYESLLKSNDHKKYKRIFKLSGRYRLNDNFDYDKHLSGVNGIAFLNPRTSQFQPEITGGAILQYMSRLWSFDSSLLSHVVDKYKEMLEDMKSRLSAGGYIDIEHLLYKHLDKTKVTHLNVVGVTGNIAPNGMGISE